MNRLELLTEIQTLDFALQDTILFLDLHPEDEDALMFYKKVKKQLMTSTKEFERNFSMLSTRSFFSLDYASYVYDKWPWENNNKEDC